jgi:hypothetical protein
MMGKCSWIVWAISKFVIACVLLSVVGTCAPSLASVGYRKCKVGNSWVNVVTADLNSPDVVVTPALSRSGIGSHESFASMMRRLQPSAAIDGTFFCTKSLKPTGDIVIDKQLVWRGCLGTAIGIRNGRELSFLPSRNDLEYRWHEFDQVMVAGPSLILGGKTVVNPKSEGFRSSVHFSRKTRAAIGRTWSNKLIFVTTKRGLLLSELAVVMKRLGCADAAVLDGGSSIGLYCQGAFIAKPGRSMTNCLLVYSRRSSYETHKNELLPTPAFTRITAGYQIQRPPTP